MADEADYCLLKETADFLCEALGKRIDDLTVDRAVFGLFFSGIKLSDGHGGLCFTPIKELPQAVCCPSSAKAMPYAGKLTPLPVREYLNDINHTNVLRRTLAIAVVNALSALYWDLNKNPNYILETGVDSFDLIELTKGQKTVVVGALVPLLKKLISAEADFHVLELDPSTLKPYEMPYWMPPEHASEVIPHADILVITGVTILNGTLPGLLKLAKKDARILITGPTASMVPDALFKRGVTMLGGILVTKTDEILDVISEAGSGYHFFGKSAERFIIRQQK